MIFADWFFEKNLEIKGLAHKACAMQYRLFGRVDVGG